MATLAEQIIAYATREIGKPYSYGDEGPNAFDCSGLMQWIFGEASIKLPRTAAQQQKFAQPISVASRRPGDLVFFGAPAYHVALYIGGNRMISAPHSGATVHITDVSGDATYGRVPGVGSTVGTVVDTALTTPVAWGVDSIKSVAGDVGLFLVVCLGGVALIGFGAWQTTKGGKT